MPDLADDPQDPQDWDAIYTEIARQLLANEDLDTNAVYTKTAGQLIGALSQGFGVVYDDTDTRKALQDMFKQNIEQFSYAKTLTQFNLFKDAMFNDKGQIQSFATVKKAVADTGEVFNNHYLRAEHQYVTQTAIMASKWETLDAEYLEFTTVGDSHVRPEHKLFDKFTALKTDPIWKRLYTPLDWGCRCTVIPGIARNLSKEYDSDWANKVVDPLVKNTIFDNNAAITGVVFNDKHPYFKAKEIDKKNSGVNFKETKDKLVSRLVKGNVEITRDELLKPIKFTSAGIKEAVNQPHEFIVDKNKMLLNIDNVLKKATYIGSKPDYKQNPMVTRIHVFETNVKDIRTFLINRELKTGEIHFYSVSDGENIIKDIKK